MNYTFDFYGQTISYTFKPLRLPAIRTENPGIAFAIATINSSPFIYNFLHRIFPELKRVKSAFCNTEIFFCINGTPDGGKTRGEIEKFSDRHGEIKITILENEARGKNKAVNLIVKTVKEKGFDIIHFLDDDVDFKKGSLLLNINTLIENQKKTDIPIIAGSHFKGLPHSFRFFRKENKSFFKAVKAYFLFSVFMVPFYRDSHNPLFISGQSYAAYTGSIPELLDDTYVITDDVFICQYTLLNGKELFARGLSPLVKPDKSIVYFKMTSDYKEWCKQYKRTFTGIWNTFRLFKEEIPFLKKHNQWAYSFIPEFTCSPPPMSPGRRLLFYINSWLRKKITKQTIKELNTGKKIGWGTAHSSKNLSHK